MVKTKTSLVGKKQFACSVDKSLSNICKPSFQKNVKQKKVMKDKGSTFLVKSNSKVEKINSDIIHLSHCKPSKILIKNSGMKEKKSEAAVKLYFPDHFSMLQNIKFLEHVADAKCIFFDKNVLAVCEDVATAEAIREAASKLVIHGNNVLHCERFGPAFCAFKRNKNDTTVLTIKKLWPHAQYNQLKQAFPESTDISLKTKMCKITFADATQCKAAYINSISMGWPGGAQPLVCVPVMKFKEEGEKDENAVHSGDLRDQFMENSCVVCIRLKKDFEIKSNMLLLSVLNTATDIILSKTCTVVFDDVDDAWKRRHMLEGLKMMGGELRAWVKNELARPGKDSKMRQEQPVNAASAVANTDNFQKDLLKHSRSTEEADRTSGGTQQKKLASTKCKRRSKKCK